MTHSRQPSARPRLAALALGLVLAAPATAEARSITVRWRYPAPERVAGFIVHVGPAPGRYTRSVDVGKPNPDRDGVYQVDVDVVDEGPAFLSVTAYDEGGRESPRSNETVRAPGPDAGGSDALGTPGRPRVVGP